MITRILPPQDWDRLSGTASDLFVQHMDPTRGECIVVEEGGAIIGTLSLMFVLHAEGVWVAPDHRKRGVVLKHLLDAMYAEGRAFGVQAVMGGSASDDMTDVLTHLDATPLPVTYYTIPIKELP